MLVFRFEQAPGIGEMQFVTMPRKKHEQGNECAGERDQNPATCSRLALSRRTWEQKCENRISNRADDQTGLETEMRQKNKPREQRADRRSGSVKQCRDAETVHPARHIFLNTGGDRWEQNAGQKRDWKHER